MLKTAIKAAKKAGKVLEKYYNISPEFEKVHHKGLHDLGSEADVIAENLVKKIIKKKFPTHNMNAEESGIENKNSEYTWFVDALDGTINFTRRTYPFCVSIGLAKNNVPVVGVVYDVLNKRLYYAEKGKGAFVNNKKIFVSKRKKLNDCILASDLTTRIQHHTEYFNIMKKISKELLGVRITNCSSLNFGLVAEGKYDVYLKNSIHWEDIVAGILLIQESGGVVKQLDGSPVTPNVKSLIGGNKIFVEKILEIIK